MTLTQKTLNELKEKKIVEVLKKVNQHERSHYEKLIKSPIVSREIKLINSQMRHIEEARRDISSCKTCIDETTEKMKKLFNKNNINLVVNNVPTLTSYNFWDLKIQLSDITFSNRKSNYMPGYSLNPGQINSESQVAVTAAKKLDDAFLNLKVAVETNNKKELNKAIKEFMELKV